MYLVQESCYGFCNLFVFFLFFFSNPIKRLTGFSPFYAKNYHEILQNNKNCKIDFNIEEKYSVKLSDAVLELLKWMLEIDPEKRPSAKQAMNHKWFLNNMTENEKKHHFTLQRQQVNLLKSHELLNFYVFCFQI